MAKISYAAALKLLEQQKKQAINAKNNVEQKICSANRKNIKTSSIIKGIANSGQSKLFAA